MNRNLTFVLLIFSILVVGCSKTPTSPSSGQWGEATANAFSSGRYGLAGAVFNGQMWAIGGASGPVTTYYSDIYSSGDGSRWTKVTGSAPFGARYGSQVLSYKGQLWLIGGNNSGTLMNDVWASSNGSNWNLVLARTGAGTATQFSPREDFGALVYNNAMWVIGGFGNGINNDVWTSTDGITWTQVLADAIPSATQFSKRWGLSATVYNNLMWVIGGASGGNLGAVTAVYGDVWSSANGSAWSKISNLVPFGSIYYEETAVHNNLLSVTGGFMGLGWGAQKEIGTSGDGLNWATKSGPFPNRFYHLSLEFNNRLWVIAGCDDYCDTTPCPPISYLNDVWYTQ